MRALRLHVDRELADVSDRFRLGAAESFRLRSVMRTRPGDSLTLFDGSGFDYPATVINASQTIELELSGPPLKVEREAPLRITLALALTRGSRMDFAIQKSVELGVASIAPLLCARSVTSAKDAASAAKKNRRWRDISIHACEQCGRSVIPKVHPPLPFSSWLATPETGPRFILHPPASQPLANAALECLEASLLIGPEGGFTDEEIASAQQAGCIGVHLGPRILRSETAACAGMAALMTCHGDWRDQRAGSGSFKSSLHP